MGPLVIPLGQRFINSGHTFTTSLLDSRRKRSIGGRMRSAHKRKKPPGTNPAARVAVPGCSGLERVDALAGLILLGKDLQAHLLADCAGEEAADAVLLPARGLHEGFQGG